MHGCLCECSAAGGVTACVSSACARGAAGAVQGLKAEAMCAWSSSGNARGLCLGGWEWGDTA